jgi:hypothetical protein
MGAFILKRGLIMSIDYSKQLDKAKVNAVILPCDCLCSTFVVEKFKWDDGSIDYSISFCDSCTDWGLNTIWNRVKAAWNVLTVKRNVYADIYIQDENRIKEFVQHLNELVCE